MAAEGLVTIPSRFGAEETVNRLKSEIAHRGLTLFAEVDHAKNAKEVAMTLRPTTVVVFGSAKAGTPLMQADQAVGIDLPLRALVWEDEGRQTWVSYNDPMWIARRHGLPEAALEIAANLRAGINAIVAKAAGC
jgi:uncharacterized protein (DUF302 family)